jgi:hypothetical protein
MSLIAEVIKYGKDIVLLGERVDALMAGRKETTAMDNGQLLSATSL